MKIENEGKTNKGNICRLCSLESSDGYELFTADSRKRDELVKYICGMLHAEYHTFSVEDGSEEGQPKWLCARCFVEASNTKEFMRSVQVGQLKLREQLNATRKEIMPEIKRKSSRRRNQKANGISRRDDEPQRRRKSKGLLDEFTLNKSPNETSPPTVSIVASSNWPAADASIVSQPLAEVRALDDTVLGEIIEATAAGTEDSTMPNHSYFICEYCRAAFMRTREFLKHIETHKNCMYECTECLQNFDQKKDFLKHQQKTGHEGIGLVEEVEKEASMFPTGVNDLSEVNALVMIESAAAKGINNHLPENSLISLKYVCMECHKEFKSLYRVRSHYKFVHEAQRTFKCTLCPAGFKTKYNHDLHLATHTGEKRHRCRTCPKSFKTNYERKRHNRVHTGEKPYNCPICNKAFTFRCNFLTHKRLHTDERPYKCGNCEAQFNTASGLKKHRNGHHLREAQIYENNQENGCSLKEVTTTNKDSHRMVLPAPQSLLKPLISTKLPESKTSTKCLPIIEKVEILPAITIPSTPPKLSSKEGDRVLASTGLNLYKFVCSVCHKKFKQSSALGKHQRTHSGERPYKCPMCPKTFADPSNFKKHKNLHKDATEALKSAHHFVNTATMRELRQMLAEQSVHIMSDTAGSSVSDPDRLGTLTYSNAPKSFTLSPSGSEFDDEHMKSRYKHTTKKSLLALESLEADDSLIFDDADELMKAGINCRQ